MLINPPLVSEFPSITPPSSTPKWVSAIGAWGDTFAACGNAQHYLHTTQGTSLGIVHYGFDPYIKVFLEAQPWVREAVHIRPSSMEEYLSVIRISCGFTLPNNTWADIVLKDTPSILKEEVFGAHINFQMTSKLPTAHMWRHTPVLPKHNRLYSQIVEQCRGKKVYLLNPISTQSCLAKHHWPYWPEALQWLHDEVIPNNPDKEFVLVGLNEQINSQVAKERYPNFINLIGKAESVIDILALAQCCDGIISTCNNLSLWAVMDNIPAVVAFNAALFYPNNYFRIWLNRLPNLPVEFSHPLEKFQEQCRILFAH